MSARPSILMLEKPVEKARELLGTSLGRLQDIAYPGLNVQTIIDKVARTVGALFKVQKLDPMDPQHVEGTKEAMDQIAEVLALLQDAGSADPAIFDASKIMAKVLSILYPITKAQLRASMLPPPEPIPLVRKEVAPHPSRVVPRIALEADIGYQSENQFYTGFSEDISEGGLFIATYDFKPIGTRISLTFTLPNGHVVMATGTVRWVREVNLLTPNVMPGMGIKFDELAVDDKSQIDQFLVTSSPMFFEGS